MDQDVKTQRHYRSPQRLEQAAQTRRAVLDAARALFATRGYSATTVRQIAERADVAVDTIYATVGRKPALLREVFETAISGADRAVPAEHREYVRAVRLAPTARQKIGLYAAAVGQIGVRTAPIQAALREAAAVDSECAAMAAEIDARRAANMLLFAGDLRGTGELRSDFSDRQVADIVWSMNGAEFYLLLVAQRGWQPERFAEFLADAWTRMLLED